MCHKTCLLQTTVGWYYYTALLQIYYNSRLPSSLTEASRPLKQTTPPPPPPPPPNPTPPGGGGGECKEKKMFSLNRLPHNTETEIDLCQSLPSPNFQFANQPHPPQIKLGSSSFSSCVAAVAAICKFFSWVTTACYCSGSWKPLHFPLFFSFCIHRKSSLDPPPLPLLLLQQ